jgi:hypothetical protein
MVSIGLGKFADNFLYQVTLASFHIHSNSSFISLPVYPGSLPAFFFGQDD